MADKRKEIHGNKAKVEPGGRIDPLFIANTVTMAGKKKHETPVVEDSNVSYARDFVNENKK